MFKKILFFLVFLLGLNFLFASDICITLDNNSDIKSNFKKNVYKHIKCINLSKVNLKVKPEYNYQLGLRFNLSNTDRLLLFNKDTWQYWIYKWLDLTKTYKVDLYDFFDKDWNLLDFQIIIYDNSDNKILDLKHSDSVSLPLIDILNNLLIVIPDQAKIENFYFLYSSTKEGKIGYIKISWINATKWYEGDYFYDWVAISDKDKTKITWFLLKIYFDKDKNWKYDDKELMYDYYYKLSTPIDITNNKHIQFDNTYKNANVLDLTNLIFVNWIKYVKSFLTSNIVDANVDIKTVVDKPVNSAWTVLKPAINCTDYYNIWFRSNGWYKIYPFLNNAKVWIKKDKNWIRLWADDTYANSCSDYKWPTDGIHYYGGEAGSGWYWIKPKSVLLSFLKRTYNWSNNDTFNVELKKVHVIEFDMDVNDFTNHRNTVLWWDPSSNNDLFLFVLKHKSLSKYWFEINNNEYYYNQIFEKGKSYHIKIVFDWNKKKTFFYVNNKLEKTINEVPNSNDNKLYVGSERNSSYSKITIKNFRIYSNDLISKPIKVYCDMETNGWWRTLVAKIAKDGKQWYYNSDLWTSDNTYGNITDLYKNEDYKSEAFNLLSFNQVKFCAKSPTNCLEEDWSWNNLKDIFAKNTTLNSKHTRSEFINWLWLPDNYFVNEPNCNKRWTNIVLKNDWTTEVWWSWNLGADWHWSVRVWSWTDSNWLTYTYKTVWDGNTRSDPLIHHVVISRWSVLHSYSNNTDNDRDDYKGEILGAIVFWTYWNSNDASAYKKYIKVSLDSNGKLISIDMDTFPYRYNESYSIYDNYISDGWNNTYDNGNYISIKVWNKNISFTYKKYISHYWTWFMTFIFPQSTKKEWLTRYWIIMNNENDCNTPDDFIGFWIKNKLSTGYGILRPKEIKNSYQWWIWIRKLQSENYKGVTVYCDFTTPGWPFGYKWIYNWKNINEVTDNNSCQDYWLNLFVPFTFDHLNSARKFLKDVIGLDLYNTMWPVAIFNNQHHSSSRCSWCWESWKQFTSYNPNLTSWWHSIFDTSDKKYQWFLHNTNRISEPNGDYYKNALLWIWYQSTGFLRWLNDGRNNYNYSHYLCMTNDSVEKYKIPSNTNNLPKSCREIKEKEPDSKSWYYWILLDNWKPAKVYCDMETNGWWRTLVKVIWPNNNTDEDRFNDGRIEFLPKDSNITEIMLEEIDNINTTPGMDYRDGGYPGWNQDDIPFMELVFFDDKWHSFMVSNPWRSNWQGNSNPWRWCNNWHTPTNWINYNNNVQILEPGDGICYYWNTNYPNFCAKKVILRLPFSTKITSFNDLESWSGWCTGDNRFNFYFKVYVR